MPPRGLEYYRWRYINKIILSKDELSQKAISGQKSHFCISGQKAFPSPKSHFWSKSHFKFGKVILAEKAILAKKHQFDQYFLHRKILALFSCNLSFNNIHQKKRTNFHNDAFWSIVVRWWFICYLINGNFATTSIYDF